MVRFIDSTTLPVLVFLGLVAFVAHFLYSGEFGFYEDDWYRSAKIPGISGHDFMSLIQHNLLPGPSQGRPLHPVLIDLLSFIGFKAGGLWVVYLISFCVLLSSIFLFYFLARRVFGDPRFAFLSALAFSIFPADTTQPYLTHGLGVQSSIALILIAMHLFVANWRKSSYIAAALSLLTYETPFLIFAFAPLLLPRSQRNFVRHGAILASLLGGIVLFRAASAEPHMSNLGVRDLLLGCLNVVLGPVTCLAMYVYRPIETTLELTAHEAGILLVFFSATTIVIVMWLFPRNHLEMILERFGTVRTIYQPKLDSSRVLLLGFAMLIAAYPLTLTTTGIAVSGRGTRVHAAAIIGASILCAWACSAILSRPRSKNGKLLTGFAVAGFFTLLLGSGLVVQRDYVLGWQEQRGFWTDLVRLCPDLSDGDVIFVEPTGLRDTRQLLFLRKELTGVPDTRQIKSLDILYDVLPAIYTFPSSWRNPPRVYRLPLDWEKRIFAGGDRLRILTIEEGFSYFPATEVTVPSSKVIFIDTRNGQLTRRYSLLNVDSGQELQLKHDSDQPTPLQKGSAYRYLIMPPDQHPAPYLVR